MNDRIGFGVRLGLGGVVVMACCGACGAQSLLRRDAEPVPVGVSGEPDGQAPLREVSLLLVETPRPRTYEIHDQITIIISEVSRQTSEQTLDTKKDTSLKAGLNKFPNLAKLLEAELTNGESSPIATVDVSSGEKFKGDGKYERSDRFTDKITAKVIDVKPNGVLVVEARRTIGKDTEVQTIVLSGECRREDVTDNNTILSSQLADLTVLSTNEGDVKDTATKGVLTRLVEAIFNF